MYPYLLPQIFGYMIPLYDVLILIGIFAMLLYVVRRFEKHDGYSSILTNKLLILIVISLLFALFSSYVIDGIFHSIEASELDFGSISFLGGLIGGLLSFYVLLRIFVKEEKLNYRRVFGTVLTGVVLAHAFGRIGCFLAGCCYGVPTESYLGVVFPHGDAHDVYGDVAVYPTQLFESFFLFMLFIALNTVEKLRGYEIETYLLSYGLWRFIIEFIRGDDRGVFLRIITTEYNTYPTPSQFMSIIMIILGSYLLYKNYHISQKHKRVSY